MHTSEDKNELPEEALAPEKRIPEGELRDEDVKDVGGGYNVPRIIKEGPDKSPLA